MPPYDHPDVIAGQGTAAKELIEEVGPLDALLVCLGGGGLLAGSALAAEALSPGAAVIGVEPEAGDDGQRSFRSGQIVRIPVPQSIADGALTQHLGQHNFPIIRRRVADVLTVSDPDLVAAMRFLRRTHEDGRRADRLPGSRRRPQRRVCRPKASASASSSAAATSISPCFHG